MTSKSVSRNARLRRQEKRKAHDRGKIIGLVRLYYCVVTLWASYWKRSIGVYGWLKSGILDTVIC